MQTLGKRPYVLDLSELHGICEGNYVRLLRLFPDYETCNAREFELADSKIHFEVIERCRYTTIFRLHQYQREAPMVGSMSVEVRAYHDARMLEVGKFQSHNRVNARYEYPNERMYQQDEKAQQNRFLADWLEHCINTGRAQLPASLNGAAD